MGTAGEGPEGPGGLRRATLPAILGSLGLLALRLAFFWKKTNEKNNQENIKKNNQKTSKSRPSAGPIVNYFLDVPSFALKHRRPRVGGYNCHFWQPLRLCWANLRSRFPPAFSLPISVLPALLSSNITLLVLSASGLLFGCSICPCFSYAAFAFLLLAFWLFCVCFVEILIFPNILIL